MKFQSFQEKRAERARKIVDWVDLRLEHEKITAKGVLEIGQKTPEKILERESVISSFGCLDKSATIAAVLKQCGFEVYLVSERVYRRGKAISVHFCVQATDGKNKFTVDPHTSKTFLYDKWFTGGRKQRLSKPLKGTTETIYEEVGRKEIPVNAMKVATFGLAGIRNRQDYLRLARVNPVKFVQSIISKANKKYYQKVAAKTARNKARIRLRAKHR